jgi:hypothetical protein
MPKSATLPPSDPLSRFTDGARISGSGQPLPLIGQRISVRVLGGFATVTTERRFRNDEAQSIEATITLPVPVHATLLHLSARIGTRIVTGIAQTRAAARETYEAAIDEGKTAVLHEEMLRGVHMLSVGHIPPGEEIAVTDRWAMPLAADDDVLSLRIPTTVGEVYGRSPLAESDDLVTSNVVHEVDFEIVIETGTARLLGATLVDGRARLRLDRPIRIEIADAVLRPLHGVAADGRAVTLTVTRAPEGNAALDAELLIDRSGSMNSPVSDAPGAPSKFAAVQNSLRAVAGSLRTDDRLGLWEFADRPVRVQPRRGAGFGPAVEALTQPGGGTELGGALAAAAAEAATDVVLVTDGMSHALEIQALARTGRRFTVVLVGADSLEANVGHLAALSGGQLFPVAEADAGRAVQQALQTLRTPHLPAAVIDGLPMRVAARIGGMLVEAVWQDMTVLVEDIESRAIGAVAAALALPRLDREQAGALAEAEGIVCHLTSLVLIDELGAAQEGLPGQRKIPLMQPAVAAMPFGMPRAATCPAPMAASAAPPLQRSRKSGSGPGAMAKAAGQLIGVFTEFAGTRLRGGAAGPIGPIRVDWSKDPDGLRRGDPSSLPSDIAAMLAAAAAHPEIRALADGLGVPPLAVAIALLASREADGDRNAARIFRSVLGSIPQGTIERLRQTVGW